ncbi:MAG: hypothetical protein RBU30_10665 [Polyangia bacterium]|jgi:hypothetical protein|nr:hypothetical protein [Polyangia bacterium]
MSDLNTQLKSNVGVRVLANLTLGIDKVVAMSIMKRPQREGEITADEMNRRAKRCVETSLMLMRERHWSSERVCDTLPDALTAPT